MKNKMTILIVGEIAAGKSTLGQFIARELRRLELPNVEVFDSEHTPAWQARIQERAAEFLIKRYRTGSIDIRFVQATAKATEQPDSVPMKLFCLSDEQRNIVADLLNRERKQISDDSTVDPDARDSVLDILSDISACIERGIDQPKS